MAFCNSACERFPRHFGSHVQGFEPEIAATRYDDSTNCHWITLRYLGDGALPIIRFRSKSEPRAGLPGQSKMKEALS